MELPFDLHDNTLAAFFWARCLYSSTINPCDFNVGYFLFLGHLIMLDLNCFQFCFVYMF